MRGFDERPLLEWFNALLAVKYYSPVTRLALIRAPSASSDQVRAGIALIKGIKKRPAAIHVLQVAGSMRTLQTHLAHWQGVVTSSLKASAAADSMVLDPAFLAALDADLETAMPGSKASQSSSLSSVMQLPKR